MNWNETIRKVLFPKTIWIFLMVNIMAASLIFIFMRRLDKQWFAYIIYVLSFYVLLIVCVRIPGIVKWWKRKLHENKYTNRYLTDKDL